MTAIREVETELNESGGYNMVQLTFGPHYFVELVAEGDGVSLYLGATHHGIKADASEVGG